MTKKMYVIRADDGMFYCGMRYWDKQLRKAKIYHSLAYAEDVSKAYEECNCKIVEVSLTIVQEEKTNADRIRAMSDEELAELFGAILREREIILLQQLRKQGVEASIVEMPELTLIANLEWLQQPAEGE